MDSSELEKALTANPDVSGVSGDAVGETPSNPANGLGVDGGTVGKLALAIAKGKELGKQALYFGCWDRPGHFLHTTTGGWVKRQEFPDLCWDDGLMDGGLLRNGKRADVCDGKVFWTCGGLAFWYAFFWWDRSGDSRSNSNSGFYVRGFGWPEAQEAFDFACQSFPRIVARQKHPLVLQAPTPEQSS